MNIILTFSPPLCELNEFHKIYVSPLFFCRREEKQYVEGMEDEEICRRETPNLAYPPAFKLEVALHAQKYSQYAAAKIFSVARRRIFDWMRQISKLQELIAKGHMKKMTGRGPKNRDIDQALYEWYSQRRAAGERPRSCEVKTTFKNMMALSHSVLQGLF